MTEVVVFYRQTSPEVDCLDGVCAAWIASKYVSKARFIGEPCIEERTDFSSFDLKGLRVVLAGFSYPYRTLVKLSCVASDTQVIDYKFQYSDAWKNNQKVARFYGGHFPGECAATAVWKYFYPKATQPWFLKHIRRWAVDIDGYKEGELPASESVIKVLNRRREGRIGEDVFSVFDRLSGQTEREIMQEGLILLHEEHTLTLLLGNDQNLDELTNWRRGAR